MVILSSPVTAKFEGTSLLPFCRYVLTQAQARQVEAAFNGTSLSPSDLSNFNSYERRYGGTPLGRKKIVIYRHTAFGDQLMMTGLVAYLKDQNPETYILYVCGEKAACVWDNNPCADVAIGAMPFETVTKGNVGEKIEMYHLFYENMLECDSQPEQNNAYDNMFAFGGMSDVPDKWKRPHIYLGGTDKQFGQAWSQLCNAEHVGDYIVYHWGSENPVRTYPTDLAEKFFKAWKHTKIVVVGVTKDPIPQLPHVIDLTNKTPQFRQLIPVLRESKGIVCPDSSIGHLAAAFPDDCRVVSLWGPFHPNDRAKYYTNHTTILGDCPHGPCRTHQFKPPHTLCKDVGAEYMRQENCSALATIKPDQIIEELNKLI